MDTQFLRLAALAVLAVPSVSASQTIDVAALDRLIAQTVERRKLVGLSVGVMHQGKVVLAKGYGVASLSTRQPVTAETMFRIGSITKQFTCGLAYQLADESRLAMSDPLSKYLPDAARGGEVSLVDLGQQVSGYRDYYPLDYPSRAMREPRDALAVVREHVRSLDFDPGTQWAYSNTNFLLLGMVIERVEDATFERVLQRRVLGPLGMRHTAHETPAAGQQAAAGYRTFALGEPTAVELEEKGWLGAAAGLWSTPSDLLAWNLALLEGKLLSASAREAMTMPRRLANGRSAHYGCGLAIGERQGFLAWSHSGHVAGFSARNVVFPATKSAVVLMTNLENSAAALADVYAAIARQLTPAQPQPPAVAGAPALATAADLLGQLQTGAIDRSRLSEEFNAFLTPERVRAAAASLGRLGKPKSIELSNIGSRGEMEESTCLIKFDSESVDASMYRTPDGRVQQFLLFRK